MPIMYHYTAYGLCIASDIALTELIQTPPESNPAIRICYDKVELPSDLKPTPGALRWATRQSACLCYEDAARYQINAGRQIVIDPIRGADEQRVRLYLLGPALAVLLHQRQLLVLHASAVSLNGKVVAFAAQKGEGKSTFAAAMHSRGHPLVADDLLPIDLRDPRRLLVQPGFPQLKLMPEAAAQLCARPDDLPRLHPDFEKRAQTARRDFPQEPLPLSRIFVLESARGDSIEAIAPQERFVELVRHSYLAPLLGMTGEAATHFKQVVALAQRVPVLRLKRRRQLATLPQSARMVEDQIAHA
jgi:hypothetical protein